MNNEKDFPLTSSRGKRYRLEERKGKRVRVYDSGAILDATSMQLAAQNEAHVITTQTAGLMAQRRREKAREQFELGAIEAVNGNSPADAQKVLGGALMKRALDPRSAAGVTAAERIAEFSGWWLKEKSQNETDPPAGTVRLTATATVGVLDLREAMRLRYEAED